jgi:hypothetical protein
MEFEKTMPSDWKSEKGAVELKDRWEIALSQLVCDGGSVLEPEGPTYRHKRKCCRGMGL